jgi:hypothetical protein
VDSDGQSVSMEGQSVSIEGQSVAFEYRSEDRVWTGRVRECED